MLIDIADYTIYGDGLSVKYMVKVYLALFYQDLNISNANYFKYRFKSL